MSELQLRAAESAEKVNPLLPEPYDIFWSAVCIVIIGFVFYKFVIPRLTRVLDERSDKIEGGLRRAETAQREAHELLAQYQQQLTEARLEAAHIREEARTQGSQILAQLKSEAQAESDRIVASGHAHLEAQRQQITAELRAELGRTAVDLAEKILGQSVADQATQAATIDRFLDEIDQSRADVAAGR